MPPHRRGPLSMDMSPAEGRGGGGLVGVARPGLKSLFAQGGAGRGRDALVPPRPRPAAGPPLLLSRKRLYLTVGGEGRVVEVFRGG